MYNEGIDLNTLYNDNSELRLLSKLYADTPRSCDGLDSQKEGVNANTPVPTGAPGVKNRQIADHPTDYPTPVLSDNILFDLWKRQNNLEADITHIVAVLQRNNLLP